MITATPHHIGCAVEKLPETCAVYATTFGLTRRTRAFDVASQHVRVCFVELGDGFYLELISPLDGEAKLASFLRTGFYHLCFLVDDLERARDELRARKFGALPPFRSEAFAERPCQFFLSPQRHLIELAQMSTADFGEFFRANLVADG
jgi:catechol 2,3-dioxygenase-like lactoylglutathione lyase family enzyme